jgi:hypothetical protein
VIVSQQSCLPTYRGAPNIFLQNILRHRRASFPDHHRISRAPRLSSVTAPLQFCNSHPPTMQLKFVPVYHLSPPPSRTRLSLSTRQNEAARREDVLDNQRANSRCRIRTLTGREIELDVEPTDKVRQHPHSRECDRQRKTNGISFSAQVAQIKEKVEEKEGIPPAQQRLIYGGKQM